MMKSMGNYRGGVGRGLRNVGTLPNIPPNQQHHRGNNYNMNDGYHQGGRRSAGPMQRDGGYGGPNAPCESFPTNGYVPMGVPTMMTSGRHYSPSWQHGAIEER